jgi:predicted secreted protein
MATNKTKRITAPAQAVKPKRSREEVMTDLCELLAAGASLQAACLKITDVKSHTVLGWVERYPPLRDQYMQARARGYQLLADEIVAISDETEVKARYNEDEVTLELDSTAIARNRLRVDTRKWMLSKMLPKVYGDKVTNEHTGANGGAIQIAAMDMKGLSDEELATMRALMLKANGAV